MLSSPLLRSLTSLSFLLPIALAGAACSGSDTTATESETGPGDDASHDDVGLGDGADGADGAVVVPDKTPPTVVDEEPLDGTKGVALSTEITVTFSESMDPATLMGSTFTLSQGAVLVPGAVAYFDRTLIFTPTSPLALATTYDAKITTAATDLAGNALTAPFHFAFPTGDVGPRGPSPVLLGSAGTFAVLAKTAISNVPTSAITGALGLSPAAASYITGFALTKVGTYWTAPEVTGRIFAADNDPPTPKNMTTAISNMETAYTDAAGRPTPTSLNLGGGTLDGLTLAPGLYKWTSSVTIPTDLTLEGAANDTWIFQITGDLKLASAKHVTLKGGARAKNVVWQVAGGVDLGTTSHAEGVILTKTAITVEKGASVNGRLLAQTAVTLSGNTVVAPAH